MLQIEVVCRILDKKEIISKGRLLTKIQKIQMAMRENIKKGNIENSLDAFSKSLGWHIGTEERLQFPKIVEVVGEEALNILNGQIITVGGGYGI